MCDDFESLPDTYSLSAHLAAGALAGIAEHSIMYPIDSVKTRMQIIHAAGNPSYTGMVHAMTKISTTEGVRSFWRGINSVILGAGPAHAVYFATYEYCKRLGSGEAATGHHPIANGLAGAGATVVSEALMNPFDVVKQRMQISHGCYRSVMHCAHTVWRNEGLRAFYISYPTSLTVTMPFQSIQFVAYEYMRKVLCPSGNYDPLTHVVAGGAAGAVAAAVTNPLDVIKTLLQTRGNSTDIRIRGTDGLVAGAKIVYSEYGMRGFLRGIKPRVLTHMPSTAISWSVYEYFKWALAKKD